MIPGGKNLKSKFKEIILMFCTLSPLNRLSFFFSGAVLLEGSVTLDSTKINAGMKFQAGGESHVTFQTDVGFAEMPIKSCMQMSRPKTTFM